MSNAAVEHRLAPMKASVFVGTSLDGFIARANGELDCLPPGGGEPHGYEAFMATVDALVIGRKTYETVLTFDTWPYGEKPVYVLSTRPLAPAPIGAVVERLSGLRPRSWRSLPRAASGTSTSMAGSPSRGFSRPDSSSVSSSPGFPCSLARGSRSLAPFSRHRPHARRDPAVRERPRPERVCDWRLNEAPVHRISEGPLRPASAYGSRIGTTESSGPACCALSTAMAAWPAAAGAQAWR